MQKHLLAIGGYVEQERNIVIIINDSVEGAKDNTDEDFSTP